MSSTPDSGSVWVRGAVVTIEATYRKPRASKSVGARTNGKGFELGQHGGMRSKVASSSPQKREASVGFGPLCPSGGQKQVMTRSTIGSGPRPIPKSHLRPQSRVLTGLGALLLAAC